MVRPTLLLVLIAASLDFGTPVSAITQSTVFWNPGPQWSCDETTGTKSRSVKKSGKETIETAPCDPVFCVLYSKATDPGPYGACIKGRFGWFRSKVLGIKVPAKYGGGCFPEQLRVVTEPCAPVDCVLNTAKEESTPFGACQHDADGWYKHKTLGIKTDELYGGKCPLATDSERDLRELCKPVDCVVNTPEEESTPFGACQHDADGWYKHKTLGIKTDELYGGKCPLATDSERDFRELCKPVDCVVKTSEEESTPFGACQHDADGWYKHKTLGIKTDELYGGKCPLATDSERDLRELCKPVDCVVNTPEEESTPFGACQHDADGWYKHKTLGIKTDELYGGKCPLATDSERDLRELCKPVDCVVNTPEEESTPFGACQHDADGWYKHKTLGIKTDELYGGKCPLATDSERDLRELCKPVDCVVNTPEEESTPFGACQHDADGWYKHKTLGIKTDELYGGKCPLATDSERDLRELCKPVDCVVKTSEEESTPFGACQHDADGWYKHKTLGIKTDELYGGKCPLATDSERDLRELCKPVDCVVKTPAEETAAAFGQCQQELNGWYKYRTLGVKTAQLYGGTCPSERDRAQRAQCTRSCKSAKPGYGIGASSYFEVLKSTTSSACCTLCLQRPKCESYVFYSPTKQCWIQSAQRTTFYLPTANAGTISSV